MVCVLPAQMCCTANHFRQCTNTSGTVIYWRLGAMVFQWQDVENNKARLILREICWQSYASHPLLLQDRAWTGYLQRHNSYQAQQAEKATRDTSTVADAPGLTITGSPGDKEMYHDCNTTALPCTLDPAQWSSFLMAAKMLLDLH